MEAKKTVHYFTFTYNFMNFHLSFFILKKNCAIHSPQHNLLPEELTYNDRNQKKKTSQNSQPIFQDLHVLCYTIYQSLITENV